MGYDVVVIGGGLAGLTAALYSARFGLSTLLIEPMMPGGQVVNSERIETFPGFPDGIGGAELGPTVLAQAEQAGAQFAMDTVTGLEPGPDGGFTVHCDGGAQPARAVIIAAGSSRRRLGLGHEEQYRGRGVSECAACDGSFFIGKRVVVVGGGDSALEEACVLVDQGVAEILIVHRGAALDAQKSLQDRASAKGNIALLFNTEVVELRGESGLSEVVMRTADGPRVETADGLFPYIGLKPNTEWLQGVVELDADGRIVTDGSLMTSVAGVFAAGDIRKDSAAQLVASAGDGASAAVAVARRLAGRAA